MEFFGELSERGSGFLRVLSTAKLDAIRRNPPVDVCEFSQLQSLMQEGKIPHPRSESLRRPARLEAQTQTEHGDRAMHRYM